MKPMMSRDPRLAAFCSPQGPEIFHSVTHHHEIWKEDPYDVEIIHREAREQLKRLLNRAITPPGPDSGRILLLLGKSGAGKTHLMRAFRNQIHARCVGYFSYMQMTTSVDNYARYILNNTLDSLDKPYHEPALMTSGLMRLSNALAEDDRAVPLRALRILREERLTSELLMSLIYKLADRIIALPAFAGVDLDLVRVLLYLQRDEPVGLKARVLKYLRCEELTDYDRKLLGGLAPRLQSDDPQRLLASFGRLVWAVDRGALVVCLDQLEDMYDGQETSVQRFRQAMKTVVSLADQVPTLVVVISCLEDFYTQLRQSLTLSLIDRIENDPEPVRLKVRRTPEEVEQLIAARLMVLYDDLNVPFDFNRPIDPFPPSVLERGIEMPRVRDILDWCRRQREYSIRTGEPPSDNMEINVPEERAVLTTQSDTPGPNIIIDLEQAWNDFRIQISALPDGDVGLCALLAWAIRACSSEMTSGHHFVTQEEGDAVSVDVYSHDNRLIERLLVCLCNQSTLGGSLARQIQAAERRAEGRIPVIVRATAFPDNPKTKVVQQLGQLLAHGGRRALIEDSDWRAMWAMQSFRQFFSAKQGFQEWLKVERPLSRLPSLRTILELDRLRSATPEETLIAETIAPASSTVTGPAQSTAGFTPLVLGTACRPAVGSVTLDAPHLLKNTAILAGSDEGLTVLTATFIEQFILTDLPVIVLDNTGSFSPYGLSQTWLSGSSQGEEQASRERRWDRLEAVLYTPGARQGQALTVPIAPRELGRLPSRERERLAHESALAMGDILGYPPRGGAQVRLTMLANAIRLLSEIDSRSVVTLQRLIDFIAAEEPALINALGQLDSKQMRRLVRDLQTLQLRYGDLFSGGQGERLSLEALLGLEAYQRPDKTRLSIIDTRFLGDNASTLFWIAQFLMECHRYAGGHPMTGLRAAILFAGTDRYLSAEGHSFIKALMEELLRQAPSSGLGILLASQNPGAMDALFLRERIGTWFIGRMKEAIPDALGLRGNTAEIDIQPANLQEGEFYCLKEDTVIHFKVNRPLLKVETLAKAQDPEVSSLDILHENS